MIDIDHFKKINDTYGHPLGDEVLKQIDNLFLVYLRNQDIIGRYGGEEFIIILPGTSKENAKKICDDLRQQFSSYSFTHNKESFSATFSAGISYTVGEDCPKDLIAEADEALYQAKANGRNQVVIFANTK